MAKYPSKKHIMPRCLPAYFVLYFKGKYRCIEECVNTSEKRGKWIIIHLHGSGVSNMCVHRYMRSSGVE